MIYLVQRLNRSADRPFSFQRREAVLEYKHLHRLASRRRKESLNDVYWPGGAGYGWNPPDNITDLELVRTLEWYSWAKKLGDVFVERLWGRISGQLFVPFKIRYRTEVGIQNFVYPRGIGVIANSLEGKPTKTPRFIDPRAHFLLTVRDEATDGLAFFINEVLTASSKEPIALDSVCPNSYTVATTAEFVAPVAEYLALMDQRRWWGSEKDVEDVAKNDLGPQLVIHDPVTAEVVMEDRNVNPDYFRTKVHGGVQPIDTNLPAELKLGDIPLTGASHFRHGHLAEAFEKCTLTDFNVIYQNFIPPEGQKYRRVVNHIVDRYAGRFDEPNETEFGAVLEELDEIFKMLARTEHAGNAVEIQMIKTHNEEAAVIYRDHKRRPMHAIHLDLALMSLLSMGVADVDDLTPEDPEQFKTKLIQLPMGVVT